jgi:hypothetical protein
MLIDAAKQVEIEMVRSTSTQKFLNFFFVLDSGEICTPAD